MVALLYTTMNENKYIGSPIREFLYDSVSQRYSNEMEEGVILGYGNDWIICRSKDNILIAVDLRGIKFEEILFSHWGLYNVEKVTCVEELLEVWIYGDLIKNIDN